MEEYAITARVVRVIKKEHNFHSRISFEVAPVTDVKCAWMDYASVVIKWQPDKAFFDLIRKDVVVDMICLKKSYHGQPQWTCEFINPHLNPNTFRYLVKYTTQELKKTEKAKLELMLGYETLPQITTRLVKHWRKLFKGKDQLESNEAKLEYFQANLVENNPILKGIFSFIMDFMMRNELWMRCDLFWKFKYNQWFQKTFTISDKDFPRAITRAIKTVPFQKTFEEVTKEVFKDNPWTCHISSHTKSLEMRLESRKAIITWLIMEKVPQQDWKDQRAFFLFWHSFQRAAQDDHDTYVDEDDIITLLQTSELKLEQLVALSEQFDTSVDWIQSPSVALVRDTTFKATPIWQKKKVRQLEDEFIRLIEERKGDVENSIVPPTYFNDLQKTGFLNIFTKGFSTIQGPAGSGKSEIIAQAIARGNAKGIRGLVLAPYNVAVENLQRRGIPSRHLMTCCSYLNHPEKALEYDFVILEEAGTIALSQAVHLLNTIQPKANVCFLGDMFQLPPIGESCAMIFQDLVLYTSPTQLTEVKRTTKHSSILKNAQSILKQSPTVVEDETFSWLKYPLFTYKRVGELNYDYLSFKVLDKIFLNWTPESLCITARNEDVLLLASYLHHKHHDTLKQFRTQPFFKHKCTISCLRAGSKVMITRQIRDFTKSSFKFRNLHEQKSEDAKLLAVKGDIGTLTACPTTKKGKYSIQLQIGTKIECYDGCFQLGYAGTTHRCQGGEVKHLYKVLPDAQCPILDARFLYVGITRGKQKVEMVGTEAAYTMAVQKGFRMIRSTLSRLTSRPLKFSECIHDEESVQKQNKISTL